MTKLVSSVSVTIFLSVAASVQASALTGSTVSVTGDYPNITSPITNSLTGTVPATFNSTEWTVQPGFFLFGVTIDVNANSIELLYNGSPGGTASGGPGVFTGYVFDFTGAPTITGVSLDPSSTFTSSQIGLGFGPNQITINGAGQTFTGSSIIDVDVALAASTVPEPQSYALILVGLCIIGVVALRRAKMGAH